MNASTNLLTVSNISKQGNEGLALNNINLVLKPAQKLAIAGETGSGKSTLMKIITGFTQPDKGTAHFDGERILGPAEQLIPGHPGIVYLSQQFELPGFLTVHQVLIYANPLSDDEAEHDPYAEDLYKMCRITHLLNRRTDQLSGGEQQRVALAKLLITSPKLLLLDEPFSNLDLIHKNILKAVINEVGEKLKMAIIMVSHDPLDTLSWADEIVVMRAGQILQQATPQIIYANPVNEYAAGLFGKYNLINTSTSNIIANVKDKRLLIRPENLHITTDKANAVKGIVNDVLFFGSYYEIKIMVDGLPFIARTITTNLQKGNEVYITFSPKDVWYL